MKEESIGKYRYQRGGSTLELLIAFAVLIMSVTAVIMVGFGNQSVSVDTETSSEALSRAQKALEDARAQSRKDFFQVASLGSDEKIESLLYRKELEIIDFSECKKEAISKVEWATSTPRPQFVEVKTVLTDIASALALGSDCDTEAPSNWSSPTPYNISDPIQSGSQGKDVDVIKRSDGRFAIVVTSKNGGQDTLWMIDTSNPTGTNFPTESTGTDEDLLAVDAVENYAFTAGASTTAQFQIFDISDASDPEFLLGVALPGVSGSQPEGVAIHYYNNRVYVGTERTSGPEFHIFDVTSPSAPTHLGSLEINHNVNEIFVQGTKAFIASSADSCELIVIDVSNPASLTNPCPAPPIPPNATVYNAAGNFDGTAIYVLSNKAYLGRARSQSSKDFYVLNISDTTNISSHGSLDLQLGSNTEVVDIIVSANTAFVGTTDTTPANGGGPFLVYDVSSPANITLVSTCSLNYSETTSGMDFVDDLIFLSNESNDAFRVLYPAPSCS
jgi:hypothetical protein